MARTRIPAAEIIAAQITATIKAQVTARVNAHITGMLFNVLSFEQSLFPRELFRFKGGFKKAVDGIARGMGYGNRDEMLEKCRHYNVGELIEFLLTLRKEVEKRLDASQLTILSLYYGKELLPCTGLLCTMIHRIKRYSENTENEIEKMMMEILYGCVMLAIPAM